MAEDIKALLQEQGEAFETFEGSIGTLNGRCDAIETMLRRSSTRSTGGDTTHDAIHDEGALELKQARAFFYDKLGRPPAEAEVDLTQFKDYCDAFRTYLRKGGQPYGQDLPIEVQKALSVGVQADGGYWVVPQMADFMVQRLFETSPMRAVARVVTVNTDAIEIPIRTNKFPMGGWVGEKDTRAATATPEIGTTRVPVHEQYANPLVYNKLLEDASFPVEDWIGQEIADEFGRQENTTFVSGNGEAKPRGFLDYGADAVTTDDATRAWGVLQYVASGNASGFAASDPGDQLIDLVHKLKPAYRPTARWLMNRATVALLRKFKDGQNNYLWSRGDMQGTEPGFLLGHPVTLAEDMPDVAANAFPVAFGAIDRGYLIVDRTGIRTLRDPFTQKGATFFYTTKRVGGDVVDFDAIKLMKIATS